MLLGTGAASASSQIHSSLNQVEQVINKKSSIDQKVDQLNTLFSTTSRRAQLHTVLVEIKHDLKPFFDAWIPYSLGQPTENTKDELLSTTIEGISTTISAIDRRKNIKKADNYIELGKYLCTYLFDLALASCANEEKDNTTKRARIMKWLMPLMERKTLYTHCTDVLLTKKLTKIPKEAAKLIPLLMERRDLAFLTFADMLKKCPGIRLTPEFCIECFWTLLRAENTHRGSRFASLILTNKVFEKAFSFEYFAFQEKNGKKTFLPEKIYHLSYIFREIYEKTSTYTPNLIHQMGGILIALQQQEHIDAFSSFCIAKIKQKKYQKLRNHLDAILSFPWQRALSPEILYRKEDEKDFACKKWWFIICYFTHASSPKKKILLNMLAQTTRSTKEALMDFFVDEIVNKEDSPFLYHHGYLFFNGRSVSQKQFIYISIHIFTTCLPFRQPGFDFFLTTEEGIDQTRVDFFLSVMQKDKKEVAIRTKEEWVKKINEEFINKNHTKKFHTKEGFNLFTQKIGLSLYNELFFSLFLSFIKANDLRCSFYDIFEAEDRKKEQDITSSSSTKVVRGYISVQILYYMSQSKEQELQHIGEQIYEKARKEKLLADLLYSTWYNIAKYSSDQEEALQAIKLFKWLLEQKKLATYVQNLLFEQDEDNKGIHLQESLDLDALLTTFTYLKKETIVLIFKPLFENQNVNKTLFDRIALHLQEKSFKKENVLKWFLQHSILTASDHLTYIRVKGWAHWVTLNINHNNDHQKQWSYTMHLIEVIKNEPILWLLSLKKEATFSPTTKRLDCFHILWQQFKETNKKKLIDYLLEDKDGIHFINSVLEQHYQASIDTFFLSNKEYYFSHRLFLEIAKAKRLRKIWFWGSEQLKNLFWEQFISEESFFHMNDDQDFDEEDRHRMNMNIQLLFHLMFFQWIKKGNAHDRMRLIGLCKTDQAYLQDTLLAQWPLLFNTVWCSHKFHDFLLPFKEMKEKQRNKFNYLYNNGQKAKALSYMVDQNDLSDHLDRIFEGKEEHLLSLLFDYFYTDETIKASTIKLINSNKKNYLQKLHKALPSFRFFKLLVNQCHAREDFKKNLVDHIPLSHRAKYIIPCLNRLFHKIARKDNISKQSIKIGKLLTYWARKVKIDLKGSQPIFFFTTLFSDYFYSSIEKNAPFLCYHSIDKVLTTFFSLDEEFKTISFLIKEEETKKREVISTAIKEEPFEEHINPLMCKTYNYEGLYIRSSEMRPFIMRKLFVMACSQPDGKTLKEIFFSYFEYCHLRNGANTIFPKIMLNGLLDYTRTDKKRREKRKNDIIRVFRIAYQYYSQSISRDDVSTNITRHWSCYILEHFIPQDLQIPPSSQILTSKYKEANYILYALSFFLREPKAKLQLTEENKQKWREFIAKETPYFKPKGKHFHLTEEKWLKARTDFLDKKKAIQLQTMTKPSSSTGNFASTSQSPLNQMQKERKTTSSSMSRLPTIKKQMRNPDSTDPNATLPQPSFLSIKQKIGLSFILITLCLLFFLDKENRKNVVQFYEHILTLFSSH